MINKVAVIRANVNDAEGFKHIMPNSEAAYMDKMDCTTSTRYKAIRNDV